MTGLRSSSALVVAKESRAAKAAIAKDSVWIATTAKSSIRLAVSASQYHYGRL